MWKELGDALYGIAVIQAAIPTPAKDLWDKAAVLAAYLLVIVGALGIIYAGLTLGKLKEQATAAKVAAEAALRQTDHIVASERAWILMSWENTGMPNWSGPGIGVAGRIAINCIVALKNYGQVPGNIFCSSLELRFCEGNSFPNDVTIYDFPIHQRKGAPYVVPPGECIRIEAEMVPPRTFLNPDIERIRNRTKYIWLCGAIRYTDSFGGDEVIHETNFCCLYLPKHGRLPARWEPSGPGPELPFRYNKST